MRRNLTDSSLVSLISVSVFAPHPKTVKLKEMVSLPLVPSPTLVPSFFFSSLIFCCCFVFFGGGGKHHLQSAEDNLLHHFFYPVVFAYPF